MANIDVPTICSHYQQILDSFYFWETDTLLFQQKIKDLQTQLQLLEKTVRYFSKINYSITALERKIEYAKYLKQNKATLIAICQSQIVVLKQLLLDKDVPIQKESNVNMIKQMLEKFIASFDSPIHGQDNFNKLINELIDTTTLTPLQILAESLGAIVVPLKQACDPFQSREIDDNNNVSWSNGTCSGGVMDWAKQIQNHDTMQEYPFINADVMEMHKSYNNPVNKFIKFELPSFFKGKLSSNEITSRYSFAREILQALCDENTVFLLSLTGITTHTISAHSMGLRRLSAEEGIDFFDANCGRYIFKNEESFNLWFVAYLSFYSKYDSYELKSIGNVTPQEHGENLSFPEEKQIPGDLICSIFQKHLETAEAISLQKIWGLWSRMSPYDTYNDINSMLSIILEKTNQIPVKEEKIETLIRLKNLVEQAAITNDISIRDENNTTTTLRQVFCNRIDAQLQLLPQAEVSVSQVFAVAQS